MLVPVPLYHWLALITEYILLSVLEGKISLPSAKVVFQIYAQAFNVITSVLPPAAATLLVLDVFISANPISETSFSISSFSVKGPKRTKGR